MEVFYDVEENISQEYKEVEKTSDSLEYDQSQSKEKIIKTKYENGKDRHFYKTKTSDEPSGLSPHNSTETAEKVGNINVSLKNETLTSIELRRLEQINGRASRLVFKRIWELPDMQDIMDLDPDILSIVEAKFGAPSCFCIFMNMKRKVEAEKQLNERRFGHGAIVVDPTVKMVPVDTYDLDSTREPRTLAVHGIGRAVTINDLKKAFPDAKEVKIAHRGGSAFLKYQDDKSCSKAFLEAEVMEVRGYPVQVLFGHVIIRNHRKRSTNSPIRNRRSLSYEWLPKKDLSFLRRDTSLHSSKTPSKVDIKSLSLALNDAGLKMDMLQSDYIKGGCDPGSGPDIRTAWMDHLKTNAKNKLSRSSRLDLVDNVWNFFDNDEDTQRRLKMEKKLMENEKSITSKKRSSTRSKNTETTSKYEMSDDDRSYKKRTVCNSDRKRERSREYTCSPDRKMHRSCDYSYSPVRRRHRYRESSYSLERKRHESWDQLRYHSRPKPNLVSSWYREDSNMSNLKDGKHKNNYDSSSRSPSPKLSNSIMCDFTEKRDADPSQLNAFQVKNYNSDAEENKMLNKSNLKEDKILKQEKRLKMGRAFALESDTKQPREQSKDKMIIAKNDPKKKEDTDQTIRNTTEYNALVKHFKTEFKLIGLKTNACLTIYEIINCFIKEGLTISDLEQQYLRHFSRSRCSEKLREELASLLIGAGFNSSTGISPDLTAGITLEFFHSSADTQNKLDKCKQSGLINIEKKITQPHQKSSPSNPPDHGKTSSMSSCSPHVLGKSIPANVLHVSEGFPRMALVVAGRLVDTYEMDQEKCKAMASAMVAVWINYGFSYSELKDMYTKEKERDPNATSDDVSLMGMRKLLHSRLRKKVEEGHKMPKKFGFSVLIDLTMFYFERGI